MHKRTSPKASRPARAKSGRKARSPKPTTKLETLSAVVPKHPDDTSTRLAAISDVKLRRTCERILPEIAEREAKEMKRKPLSPATSASNFLLKAVYRETRLFLEQDRMAVVNDAVLAVAQCKAAPEDPFASFLLLIKALQGEVTKAARNQIRKQAIALSYANERNVPMKFLVGFIYQVGGLKRIGSNHVRRKKKG